jgi:predicted component of type VI protein secretion system
MTPDWLVQAAQAQPGRFPFVTVAAALPKARLAGPRSLAVPPHQVVSADADLVATALLGLAGPCSPLPAGMAQELANLPPGSAAAGLRDTIEDRLLRLLLDILNRRAVDDAAQHQAMLGRLAGPLGQAGGAIVGRICDGRSADALAQRLRAAAGCPISIMAATGGEMPLGPGVDSHLGEALLGVSQSLGSSVHAAEFGCRITLGPISLAVASRLRPGGDRHHRVLLALHDGLPGGVHARVDLLVEGGAAVPLGAGGFGLETRLAGASGPAEREILLADVFTG